MVPGGQTDFARGAAAHRLAQLRRQTLELLLAVALAARLAPILMYGVVSWRAGNYPFLVTAAFEVIAYSALLAGRRLPLRLRAWGYCLVWMVVFAVYVPRGVFAASRSSSAASWRTSSASPAARSARASSSTLRSTSPGARWATAGSCTRSSSTCSSTPATRWRARARRASR